MREIRYHIEVTTRDEDVAAAVSEALGAFSRQDSDGDVDEHIIDGEYVTVASGTTNVSYSYDIHDLRREITDAIEKAVTQGSQQPRPTVAISVDLWHEDRDPDVSVTGVLVDGKLVLNEDEEAEDET